MDRHRGSPWRKCLVIFHFISRMYPKEKAQQQTLVQPITLVSIPVFNQDSGPRNWLVSQYRTLTMYVGPSKLNHVQ